MLKGQLMQSPKIESHKIVFIYNLVFLFFEHNSNLYEKNSLCSTLLDKICNYDHIEPY